MLMLLHLTATQTYHHFPISQLRQPPVYDKALVTDLTNGLSNRIFIQLEDENASRESKACTVTLQ